MTLEQIRDTAAEIAARYKYNGVAEDIHKCTQPHELRGWISIAGFCLRRDYPDDINAKYALLDLYTEAARLEV